MYVDLLSASQKNATSEPRAISNARVLYQTCLNEDQIEAEDVTPILSLINQELGGWPILQGTQWNNASFNLLNLLVTLRTYSNNVIFAMGTSTDEKNSTEYDIEVTSCFSRRTRNRNFCSYLDWSGRSCSWSTRILFE